MTRRAFCAERVLTPSGFREHACVLIDGGRIEAVIPREDCPQGVEREALDGDLLPGFIDLQVNGGGGVLFNDRPTVEGVTAIAEAHRRFGTVAMLPTLISDELEVVARAIAAVAEAIERGVPGVIGIHVEGPFLNPKKKGIHDAAKFRTPDAEAIGLLSSLRTGRSLVTLAPELAPPGTVRALAERGVVVAAGHSQASYEQVQAALDEGLGGFTHLFNAMTQLGSRKPGMVGAALEDRKSWCGLIVDGRHVHPATLRIALAAKGADKLLLVTDAMPTVGWDRKAFRLGGQTITAKDGYCVAPDGTLAGSNLDMATAVRNAVAMLGVDLPTAVRMASAVPAKAIGVSNEQGEIAPGKRADLVLMDASGQVAETWIGGVRY